MKIRFSILRRVLYFCFGLILSHPGVSFADTDLATARFYQQEGDMKKSNYYYLRSIWNDENVLASRYELSLNYFSVGDLHSAEKQLSMLLESEPMNVLALAQLCNVYSITGNIEKLTVLSQRLEALDQSSAAALKALDSAYLLIGNAPKADRYSKMLTEARNAERAKAANNTGNKSNNGISR